MEPYVNNARLLKSAHTNVRNQSRAEMRSKLFHKADVLSTSIGDPISIGELFNKDTENDSRK